MAKYKGKTIKTAKGIAHNGTFMFESGESFAVTREEIVAGHIDPERMCVDVAKVFVAFRQSSGYVKHAVKLSNAPIEGDGSQLFKEALAAGDATFRNDGKSKVHLTVSVTASRRE